MNRDPRPGRRPRTTSGAGPSADIGEPSGEAVATGFYAEPDELPADVRERGEQREEDQRALTRTAASHVEPLPFANLSRDAPVRTSLRGSKPVPYSPTGAKAGRLPR